MIKCKYSMCCAGNYCSLFGCLMFHHLIEDRSKEVYEELHSIGSNKRRMKRVINLFQEREPPKIRKDQIDRYYKTLKDTGIDIDKPDFSPDQIRTYRE